MKLITAIPIIACVALAYSPSASAQVEQTETTIVRYASNHDPGWIVFEDGHEVRVQWDVPGSLTFEDVNKWRPGQLLSIRFGARTGPILVDSVTNRSIPIIGGLDKHPIDLLLSQCLETGHTTIGMVDCYSDARARWDTEMNRLYSLVLSRLATADQDKLRIAQRAWIEYRDRTIQALGAVFTQGSIANIDIGAEAVRVTKEQAQRLERFNGAF